MRRTGIRHANRKLSADTAANYGPRFVQWERQYEATENGLDVPDGGRGGRRDQPHGGLDPGHGLRVHVETDGGALPDQALDRHGNPPDGGRSQWVSKKHTK